jgi:hypothetical protein
LGTGNPDDNAEPNDFDATLEHKRPANPIGSGINRLVNQSWSPPKVGQVAERDVLGIWTGAVKLGDFACVRI